MELGGGRRERSGDDVDEREGGGDRDAADAEVSEGEVDVSDGGEEAGGEVRGGGVFVEEVVADGDGGDFGARVEWDDVEVEPAERDGAVGGDGRDQGVGDCEEERGVCVGEGAGESWVWVEYSEGGEFESGEGGRDLVRRRWLGGGGGGGVRDAELGWERGC